MLDTVRAARKLDKRLGRRVIIAGHSQGGHAALWAASLAPKWTPELKVRGTVALAPGLAHRRAGPAAARPHDAERAQRPRRDDPARRSTSRRRSSASPARLGDARGGALPADADGVPPSSSRPELVRRVAPADADPARASTSARSSRRSTRERPDELKIRTPVRDPAGRRPTRRCSRRSPTSSRPGIPRARMKVTYKTYTGVDHGGAVKDAGSARDATSYIKSRLLR